MYDRQANHFTENNGGQATIGRTFSGEPMNNKEYKLKYVEKVKADPVITEISRDCFGSEEFSRKKLVSMCHRLNATTVDLWILSDCLEM